MWNSPASRILHLYFSSAAHARARPWSWPPPRPNPFLNSEPHIFLHCSGTILTHLSLLAPFYYIYTCYSAKDSSPILPFLFCEEPAFDPHPIPCAICVYTLSTQPELLIRLLQSLSLVLSNFCSPVFFSFAVLEVPKPHSLLVL